jgi:hypothetical protein
MRCKAELDCRIPRICPTSVHTKPENPRSITNQPTISGCIAPPTPTQDWSWVSLQMTTLHNQYNYTACGKCTSGFERLWLFTFLGLFSRRDTSRQEVLMMLQGVMAMNFWGIDHRSIRKCLSMTNHFSSLLNWLWRAFVQTWFLVLSWKEPVKHAQKLLNKNRLLILLVQTLNQTYFLVSLFQMLNALPASFLHLLSQYRSCCLILNPEEAICTVLNCVILWQLVFFLVVG